eukprot:g5475.t1
MNAKKFQKFTYEQASFEKYEDLKEVLIEQCPDGIASSMRDGAGAWNYMLWPAARVMARYMEREFDFSDGSITALELGAGTGLTSIAAAQLGCNACVTDLPCAMPLLKHNICLNYGSPINAFEKSKKGSVVCGEAHPLNKHPADCEDYMCDVCGNEIDVGKTIFSCDTCSFDICGVCGDSALQCSYEKLPSWFTIQCKSAEKVEDKPYKWNVARGSGSLTLCPFDFLDDKAIARTLEAMNDIPDVIFAADCTFTKDIVRAFVRRLVQFRDVIRNSHEKQSIRLIIVHENRSEEVTSVLKQELREKEFKVERRRIDDLGVYRAKDVLLFESKIC